MTTFTFIIPAITPSLNRLVKNRTNQWAYCKLKKDWFNFVKLGSQYLDIPQAVDFEKRKVEIISYRLSLLDQDNLGGGMKLLWDAMVQGKYLYDDSEEYLETGKPTQVRVGKRKDQKTEVRLTIFEEEP